MVTFSSVVKADNQDVLDKANVLDYKTEQYIAKVNDVDLAKVEHHPQIAVVTENNIPDLDSEGQRLFDKYHFGRKGYDNGVLLLIGINDHKFRMQPGYGLESKLPDLFVNQLMDDRVKNLFRNEDYNQGVRIMVKRTAKQIASPESESDNNNADTDSSDSNSDSSVAIGLTLLLILSPLLIGSLYGIYVLLIKDKLFTKIRAKKLTKSYNLTINQINQSLDTDFKLLNLNQAKAIVGKEDPSDNTDVSEIYTKLLAQRIKHLNQNQKEQGLHKPNEFKNKVLELEMYQINGNDEERVYGFSDLYPEMPKQKIKECIDAYFASKKAQQAVDLLPFALTDTYSEPYLNKHVYTPLQTGLIDYLDDIYLNKYQEKLNEIYNKHLKQDKKNFTKKEKSMLKHVTQQDKLVAVQAIRNDTFFYALMDILDAYYRQEHPEENIYNYHIHHYSDDDDHWHGGSGFLGGSSDDNSFFSGGSDFGSGSFGGFGGSSGGAGGDSSW